MDTFMDKLAQKLTAQEMIKANMAADAEEMNKLKSKAKEYSECLEQMQRLVETGTARLDKAAEKLENAKVDGSEINRLVEAGIVRINDVQKDTEAQINAEIKTEIKTVLEEIKNQLNEKPEFLEDIKKLLEEKPSDLDETKKLLEEKLEPVNENVHKECVKVYRNVQAVVVEENNKQTDKLRDRLHALRSKVNAVMGVSIAALVVATASLVVQILNLLNVKFF